jgi:UDP-N-acetylglucosamine 2-epimerase (non-hydrolysing)
MGCIAAAQLNIPVVHIEGCMRSYDWRMPEEKYRTIIDHVSDVVYTYFDEYKEQGVRDGLNPRNIVVIQNLIVDVLQHYYFGRPDEYEAMASEAFFRERGIERDAFYLMTCHRRESVESPEPLRAILELIAQSPWPIYFTASYRTQRRLVEFGLSLPSDVIMVDPIGYKELLVLLANSRGALTDSGTVVEETAIIGVPSLQIRKATERPQVYDCGSSVKFDPARPEDYPHDEVFAKLEGLYGRTFDHGLGDGHASERLVEDLVRRVTTDTVRGHRPEDSHIDVSRSYREDGLVLPKV